jgi:hypothetical protein
MSENSSQVVLAVREPRDWREVGAPCVGQIIVADSELTA